MHMPLQRAWPWVYVHVRGASRSSLGVRERKTTDGSDTPHFSLIRIYVWRLLLLLLLLYLLLSCLLILSLSLSFLLRTFRIYRWSCLVCMCIHPSCSLLPQWLLIGIISEGKIAREFLRLYIYTQVNRVSVIMYAPVSLSFLILLQADCRLMLKTCRKLDFIPISRQSQRVTF